MNFTYPYTNSVKKFETNATATIVCLLVLFFTCDFANAIISGKIPITIKIRYDENHRLQYEIVNLNSLVSCEAAVAWCWRKHKETEGSELWYQNAVCLEFHEDIEELTISEICEKFVLGKIYPLEVSLFSKTRPVEFKFDQRRILEKMFPNGIPQDILKELEKREKESKITK